jgi:hypothetical protein
MFSGRLISVIITEIVSGSLPLCVNAETVGVCFATDAYQYQTPTSNDSAASVNSKTTHIAARSTLIPRAAVPLRHESRTVAQRGIPKLYLNDALVREIAQLVTGLGFKSVERVYFDRFKFYAYYARAASSQFQAYPRGYRRS